MYGELWNQAGEKLIFVISEVMKNKDFENSTRESALEIIVSVAESHPKLLKDNVEAMKIQFFPSLCVLMTKIEDDDDLEAWFEVDEENVFLSNDPASRAAGSLERLCTKVGSSMTLKCCIELIHEMVNSAEW